MLSFSIHPTFDLSISISVSVSWSWSLYLSHRLTRSTCIIRTTSPLYPPYTYISLGASISLYLPHSLYPDIYIYHIHYVCIEYFSLQIITVTCAWCLRLPPPGAQSPLLYLSLYIRVHVCAHVFYVSVLTNATCINTSIELDWPHVSRTASTSCGLTSSVTPRLPE